MNRKTKKLLFIRSKNFMKKRGYIEPKWKLINHRWPTQWANMNPTLIEEMWITDMRIR